MTRLLTTMTLLAMPALATAEDMTDPTEILKKVDAAALRVTAASYTVHFEGLDGLKDRAPKFSGTYTIEGWNNGVPKRWHAQVQGTRPGSTDMLKFEAGGNGENYYLINHTAKKAYEDMDPEVLGSAGQMIMAGFMAEFVHPSPFSDELKADKRELESSTKLIDNKPCYEIHVVYSGGRGEAIWSFDKTDFLPRARVDVFKRDGMDGKQRKVISQLKIDPKLDDKLFTLQLPEGYEKIDDFAP